ncbi:MAG: glycerol-3-phosphate acyltransferase [Methanomassiliicoccales archaeon]
MNGTVRENIFRRSQLLQEVWSRPRLVIFITYVWVVSILVLLILNTESWVGKALLPAFFLYASIPFPMIFVRIFRGKDVTLEGSGNISLSNSFRVGGWAAGSFTWLGEISKALLPILVSWAFFSFDIFVSAAFLAASLLGTFYSPFLKGRGGLGTTLAIWGLLLLSPWSLLAILALAAFLLITHKNTYQDTLAAFWAAPLLIYLIDGRWPLVLLALLYALIYSIRLSPQRDELAHGIRIAKK